MSEQEFGSAPPPESTPAPEAAWGPPPPTYTAPPPVAAAPGLSESAASALAYVTFIPAVIFLLFAPYNLSAKVRFHAIQEIGLTICQVILTFFLIIPFLGWLIFFVGFIALFVMWVLCIVKASQGGAFKLPLISSFAASQSGYVG
jgi:uncharacterized membrane protein